MFITYFPPQYSGAAKQAISLAKVLRDKGHRVEFATVQWPVLAHRDEHDGFAVHRIEQGRGSRHREFRLWWNMLRFALAHRGEFDIIHSHGAYYTNCFVGPLARMAGWKSIVKASLADGDLHGVDASLAGRIHGTFLRSVDACVAISCDLEREFRTAGVQENRIHYLPNGVDTDRFRPAAPGEREELRRMLEVPTDRPLVLTAGVFDRRKNIGWLIEEWVRHKGFATGALLLAIGPRAREDTDGSFLASLRELTGKNEELIRMMGQVNDIERYYRAADVFILPSHSEGMPNVVLEAMASGVPCVASRVSGTMELVEEEKTGFVFEPGDAQGLGTAIHKALACGNGPGRESRARALHRYSIIALADRYAALYAHLMTGRGATCPSTKDIRNA
jgi:glycosyltransferase involved in cell wall biosynthesis